MTVLAHIDGASRGNPGDSGIGIVLRDAHRRVLTSAAGYIGKATNNIAEYTALIECLKKTKKLGCTRLVVHSDSELMVRQMTGVYRVKDEGLKKFFRQVHRLLDASPIAFEIHHVPREANREADLLANMGIDRRSRLRWDNHKT